MSVFQQVYNAFYCNDDLLTYAYINEQTKKLRLIQWGTIAYAMGLYVLRLYHSTNSVYTVLAVFVVSLYFFMGLASLWLQQYQFVAQRQSFSEHAYDCWAICKRWYMNFAELLNPDGPEFAIERYERMLLVQEMNKVRVHFKKVLSAISLVFLSVTLIYGVKLATILSTYDPQIIVSAVLIICYIELRKK